MNKNEPKRIPLTDGTKQNEPKRIPLLPLESDKFDIVDAVAKDIVENFKNTNEDNRESN